MELTRRSSAIFTLFVCVSIANWNLFAAEREIIVDDGGMGVDVSKAKVEVNGNASINALDSTTDLRFILNAQGTDKDLFIELQNAGTTQFYIGYDNPMFGIPAFYLSRNSGPANADFRIDNFGKIYVGQSEALDPPSIEGDFEAFRAGAFNTEQTNHDFEVYGDASGSPIFRVDAFAPTSELYDSTWLVEVGFESTGPDQHTNLETWGRVRAKDNGFQSVVFKDTPGARGPELAFLTGMGTRLIPTPFPPPLNEPVGVILAQIYDGDDDPPFGPNFNKNTADVAYIAFIVDGATVGPRDAPGRIEFATTPDDQPVLPIPRMVIKNDGRVGINHSAPGSLLDIKSPEASINVLRVTASGINTFPIFVVSEAANSHGVAKMLNGSGATKIQLNAAWDSFINGRRLGINTTTPEEALDVDGKIQIRDSSSSDATTGIVLFSTGYGAVLYVRNDNGLQTQTTSHRDPREMSQTVAATSFADPAVVLPFSFHHSSDLIGKGAVVDMAKMVAYVERMMQTELGVEQGRLVHVYDLPASEVRTVAQWESLRVAVGLNLVRDAVQKAAPVRVMLDANGEFPLEAIVEVPEILNVEQVVTEMVKEIDLDSARIVEVERTYKKRTQVETGEMVKRLAEGWEFRGGELYRPPTSDDVDVQAILADFNPGLPQWLVDRIPGGAQSASVMLEAIREKVVAQLRSEPVSAVALAGPPPSDPEPVLLASAGD